MPDHDAAQQGREVAAAASPPAVALKGAREEGLGAAAAAARSMVAGSRDAAGVLALQRAAGNAAVGRVLAREPGPAAPAKVEEDDPFVLTEEELAEIEAAAAKFRAELREQALTPLEGRGGVLFLSKLRDLQPGQRMILMADEDFWKRVRRRLSGLALWAVQITLQYGHRRPHELNALHHAIHAGEWLHSRELIMAYPSLKTVPGLREVIRSRFARKEADDLLAVIAEAGARAESGVRSYKEAHYEDGKIKRFVGTRNYELVRLSSQLRVIVRIRLKDDPATKGSAITDKAVTRWEQGINRRWNGKFRIRSGGKALDVWFLPVFVYHDPSAHHHVTVKPGEDRSSEHEWHEEDTGDTAAHEFGHMIGNPDEYNLPGTIAEIPKSLGLTAAEAKRSSYEGLAGKKGDFGTEGIDMENLMGAHHVSASLRARHGWDVLEAFNATLRLPGEAEWTLELKA